MAQNGKHGHPHSKPHPTISISTAPSSKDLRGPASPTKQTPSRGSASSPTQDQDDATWGSNFWVTLVDPQTGTSFFACPASGQVSWDPPVGSFVLPPSEEGEWWELTDESRGLAYYYQTKTGETVWERPPGFVIPLGILQNNALGRRLSMNTFDHFSKLIPTTNGDQEKQSAAPSEGQSASKAAPRRTTSGGPPPVSFPSNVRRQNTTSVQLTPIPGSPYASDASSQPSQSKVSLGSVGSEPGVKQPGSSQDADHRTRKSSSSAVSSTPDSASTGRSRPYRSPQPQSLHAAIEILTNSPPEGGPSAPPRSVGNGDASTLASGTHGYTSSTEDIPGPRWNARAAPASPRHPIPDPPPATLGGKPISSPILNHAATLQMSPVKNRANGQPIPVDPSITTSLSRSMATLSTGTYPILPQALASDIQQFSESDYARQYFSTHRTGFIFRRTVPVAQVMTWQKAPLTTPLLLLNRDLHKNAVKLFKVIQHIMGDRERERPVNVRLATENQSSVSNTANASSTSLPSHVTGILEEERWLLGEGLTHGELRDEIYCQVMKQLTGNPGKESVFRGWQLICVLLTVFPPSKNFETYLHGFIQSHIRQQEGRVDVMAKYCLRRLVTISRKGPRGKPPSIAEIETASDAAFNPSTFGESLDGIIRLQERNYPHAKIPIILPFLGDGILALGGTKAEGIFRVPGDNDSISALKLRIDRGYYTLDGVDDPHVLASLMKLWLRELCDPLVPEELYNECVQNAKDPEACIQIVERLPTTNRRVVLFVISFLQIFLDDRTQSVTKMTPANLALVMAPNLLRCNSDSMAVVFTNAQYEQVFVYNLLLHLRCDETDPGYKPVHGLGAVSSAPPPKTKRVRRQ